MSKLWKILPERLVAARQTKGWSQEALARAVKVSQNQVGKWEGGSAVPYPRNLVLLAEALGVSAAYLIGEDASASPPPGMPIAGPPAAGAAAAPPVRPIPPPEPQRVPGPDIMSIVRATGPGPGVVALPYYSGVSCGHDSEIELEDEVLYVAAPGLRPTPDLAAVKARGDSMVPTVCAGDIVVLRRLSRPIALGLRRAGRPRIPVQEVSREAPHRTVVLVQRGDGLALKRLLYDRRKPEWHLVLWADNPAVDPVVVTAEDEVTILAVATGIIQA